MILWGANKDRLCAKRARGGGGEGVLKPQCRLLLSLLNALRNKTTSAHSHILKFSLNLQVFKTKPLNSKMSFFREPKNWDRGINEWEREREYLLDEILMLLNTLCRQCQPICNLGKYAKCSHFIVTFTCIVTVCACVCLCVLCVIQKIRSDSLKCDCDAMVWEYECMLFGVVHTGLAKGT